MTVPSKKSILVTGANGFVGTALCAQARAVGYSVRGTCRSAAPSSHNVSVGSITGLTDWSVALKGMAVVVHLAARVHVLQENVLDPLLEFRRVNVDATLNLAKQAANAGVKRFIFISSIKVNGESTELDTPFRADDTLMPIDSYGLSKREAEAALLRLGNSTGMEIVIIRPPLVYGAGVKANFYSMMRWLDLGIPLPLGAVHNQRSFVALENLVDLIITCINHPAAVAQVFLVSDGEDLSTSELLRRMAIALGKPARLFSVPVGTLQFIAKLLNKQAVAQRLCGSLQLDISKTRQMLDWTPPISVDEALKKAAQYYRSTL